MTRKLDFAQLQERCTQRVAEHADRDEMYRRLEQMFLMEWEERPGQAWIKQTLSPDPHNTIVGITRLMTSTEPQIAVEPDDDTPASVELADKIEKACDVLWHKINRVRQIPLHYEACQSAALYAEVCLLVANVADTVRFVKATGKSASRIERMVSQCPFSVRCVSPRTVYPEYDEFGLASVLWRQQRRVSDVVRFWGKLADKLDATDGMSWVTYNEYWDDTWRVVWCNDSEPLLMERHNLPFIPWVCTTVTGSGLFSNPKHKRHPMLYPMLAGQWWQRANLLLTQMFTSVGLLMQPAWEVVTLDGQPIPISPNEPGAQVNLRPGESIRPLARQLIDPSVSVGLSVINEKTIQSTIPRVVFGESPGATMSYSAMNLLSQGGRLPLVPIERQVGKALAWMFEIMLQWVAHSGDAVRLGGAGEMAELRADEINADNIRVSVKLRADVPQDRLQMANMVTMLRNSVGPDGLPLISADTARAFLDFMQPGDEAERVAREVFVREHMKRYLSQQAELQEQYQQRQGAALPVGLPPVQLTGQPPGVVEQMPGVGGGVENAEY